jgi:hypothetical protein
MTTDRQAESNRQNGQKSHGPTTPEGLEKCRNANLRTGILSTALVLEGECSERLSDLINAYLKRFQPRDVHETTLVETMAMARWRQMRLWAIENASINYEIVQQSLKFEKSNTGPIDAVTRAALAFRSLEDHSASLRSLNRYEARYDRQYKSAYKSLQEHRAKSDPNTPLDSSDDSEFF